MRKALVYLLAISACLMFTAGMVTAQETQSVALTVDETTVVLGEDVVVSAMYGHSDNYGTTGIDLRIHYDSSKFTFKSSEILVGAGDVFGDVADWDDSTDNYDSDAATDKYIRVNYDLMAEEWPYATDDSNLPITDPLLNLFNLTFTAAVGTGTTAFNVTADQKAATAYYDFVPTASDTVGFIPEPAKPTVTTSLTPETGAGSISPEGTTEYNTNSSPVYEITVATGYRIKECKVNDTVVEVALKTGETDIYQYSFDPLTADATISVEFEEIPKFKITSSAGSNGTISPADENEVLEGEPAVYTITITGAHYEIDAFTVSTDSSALDKLVAGTDPNIFTYTFESVSADANVNVTFKLKIYKVTSTADTGGSISDPGLKEYGATAEVTRTITPLGGYEVATFTVDGGPDVKDTLTKNADGTSTYTIASLEKDTAVNVTFQKLQYTVTATVTGDGGTITPATATAYDAGTEVQIEVTPTDACYVVDTFTVSTDDNAALTDNKYTITAIVANADVNVTFKKIQYTVTPSVAGDAGGTITPAAATDYDCGDDVQIEVTPAAGYKVKTFTVDTDGTASLTANKYTLAINANAAVTVTFELDNPCPEATTGLTLEVAPGEVATVQLAGTDEDGTIVSYAVTAGSKGFVGVNMTTGLATYEALGSATGTDIFTFTVTDDKGCESDPATVDVIFITEVTYTLTASVAGTGGSVTPTEIEVIEGDSAIFTVTTDAGYGVNTVTDSVAGVVTLTGNTYTVTNVTADRSITVTFTANTDPVPQSAALSATAGEMTSGTLVATDADGDTLTYTITQQPAKGQVILVGAAYTYTANDTTVPTTDTFIFTVDDGKGGTAEGTITVNIVPPGEYSSADMDRNYEISLSELLRVQQLYTQGSFHCDSEGEDGYALGSGDETCVAHTSDYNPQDWEIGLSEFLRVTQFYNLFGYHVDPDGEDGFAAGPE